MFVLTVVRVFPEEDAVVQVAANDPDSPPNSQTRFDLSEITFHRYSSLSHFSSVPGSFAINPYTGIIFALQSQYEEFLDGFFSIKVMAFDDLDNSLFDMMIVKVL